MRDSSSPDPRVTADLEAIDAALDGRAVDPERESLGHLAVLLRDERPTVASEAARRLDERFAVSLRNTRPRSRDARRRGLRAAISNARWTWWPAAAAVACVLLAAVVVLEELRGAGQLGQTSSSSERARAVTGASGADDEAGGAEAGLAAPASDADSAASRTAEPAGPGAGGIGSALPGPTLGDPTDARDRRLVERSAFLALATPPGDLADVASSIVRTTDDVGGYVASSTVGETADDRGSAGFELRVPARELPRTLAALSRLAQVTERSESTRDVTADAGRTARRVAGLRAERRGLLRALERAETARESARIRARLRLVDRRTAAARAAGRRLRNRAAFATISVNLAADSDAGTAAGDGRWTPADAVQTAIRVLEVAVGVALVAAALAVPLALAAAALAWATRLARRRRARVLDAG